MSKIEYDVEQYDGSTFTLTATVTMSADEYKNGETDKVTDQIRKYATDGYPEIVTEAINKNAIPVRPIADVYTSGMSISPIADGSYIGAMLFDYTLTPRNA